MKAFIIIFALLLCLIPKTASANDWCDVNPDSPECGDLTEPALPVIGPPCSSDFEWSCYSNNIFLPGVMK